MIWYNFNDSNNDSDDINNENDNKHNKIGRIIKNIEIKQLIYYDIKLGIFEKPEVMFPELSSIYLFRNYSHQSLTLNIYYLLIHQ